MKVFFASLGCDKNKVDSEKILKFLMKKNKFTVVEEPEGADIAILNTCSFIRDAKDECISWLKYLTDLKKSGKLKKIMMLGCLATEYVRTGRPVDEHTRTGRHMDEHTRTGRPMDEHTRTGRPVGDIIKNIDIILPLSKYVKGLDNQNDRVCDILSFSSFIKICDGCDKFCSYCIIPYLRGRFHSNAKENILKEVKLLARSGVKELSIVGQDILNYGSDFKNYKGEKKPIVDLIDDISKIKGIEWIRLLYCYPESIDESVIGLLRENEKVLPYIDMPIQHISDKILKSMNRKTSASHIRGIIYKLRATVPDIVIRTTLMVGFPGETEKDFKELCDFVKEMRFDKLGVFTYSREKLSSSYNFPNHVNDSVKEKRKKILLDIQKNIVIEKNLEHIGMVYNAIVEGYDSNKKMYVVRPYFDARGIDDNVYVKTTEKLISGTFVNVLIEKVLGMDLIGTII